MTFEIFLIRKWHDDADYRVSMGTYPTNALAMKALRQQMDMSPTWYRGVVYAPHYDVDIVAMINPEAPEAYLAICDDENGNVMCANCDCWKQTRAGCM